MMLIFWLVKYVIAKLFLYRFFETMARQFSPQERLGDFVLNIEASATTVETLRNFLCTYEPTYRKKIINAKLPRFQNRASVHLAAEKGLAPFLRILLKHGGIFE